jgi:hypothetical protein
MSLRALSGEHETKNRCKVPENYEQRFFAVYRHFISLNSPPQDKIYPKTVANLGFNQRQWFFGAGVLAAPSSRAAVSLSYLTARAKSECWKAVVNLVSLALG